MRLIRIKPKNKFSSSFSVVYFYLNYYAIYHNMWSVLFEYWFGNMTSTEAPNSSNSSNNSKRIYSASKLHSFHVICVRVFIFIGISSSRHFHFSDYQPYSSGMCTNNIRKKHHLDGENVVEIFRLFYLPASMQYTIFWVSVIFQFCCYISQNGFFMESVRY